MGGTFDQFAARIDALSVAELRASGSLKWSTFPNALGGWVAEMDFGLAAPIKATLQHQFDRELTGYIPMAERDLLRQATADYQRERFGWDLDPSRIHGLPDVLAGLGIAMTHFTPSGKVAILTPAYMPFLLMPGGWRRELVQVPMIQAEDGWTVDYEALDRAFADGVVLLVLCNPHNPIGKVYRRAELERIAEIVESHHGRVFSDEIHAPLTFPGHQHLPYASINSVAAGHTITAVACSKAWNTAGLKCAQLILTNDQDLGFTQAAGHGLPYGPSVLGVYATIAAYSQGQPWLDNALAYLDRNRRLLSEQLAARAPGLRLITPQATYLAWIDIRDLGIEGDPTVFFSRRGLALTNGAECGDAGRGFVRLNFATPTPVLRQMIDILVEAGN